VLIMPGGEAWLRFCLSVMVKLRSAINGLQADSVFDDYSRKCGRVLRRVEQKHRPQRRLYKNKNLIICFYFCAVFVRHSLSNATISKLAQRIKRNITRQWTAAVWAGGVH